MRAVAVGSDMVLVNAPADRVSDVTRRVTRAIVAAVVSGDLPRTRLRGEVVHVLRAKHVTLCPAADRQTADRIHHPRILRQDERRAAHARCRAGLGFGVCAR